MLKKNIPNTLTCYRLLSIPFFVALMASGGATLQFIAAVVFACAALSDYLDGYLARLWKVESSFGKLVDPLADKLLVMAGLIMIIGLRDAQSGRELVPAWLVFLLLGREVWVTGLRGVAAERGLILAAGLAGKVKAMAQMIGICLLVFPRIDISFGGSHFGSDFLGVNFLWVSLIFSYWGAIDYTFRVFALPEPESTES